MLLVLEDLHWADLSTLDLVAFLAHNLDDHAVLLVATFRHDEPLSAQRMRRLADGVRRSGSGLVLELGSLDRDALVALLAAQSEVALPATLADTIMARSEGNPFFAQELLAASRDGAVLPTWPPRPPVAARGPPRPACAGRIAADCGGRA